MTTKYQEEAFAILKRNLGNRDLYSWHFCLSAVYDYFIEWPDQYPKAKCLEYVKAVLAVMRHIDSAGSSPAKDTPLYKRFAEASKALFPSSYNGAA